MIRRKLKQALLAVPLAVLLVAGCASAPKASGSAGGGQVIPDVPLVNKGPKKKVAVLAFENKAKYGQGRLGDVATDILLTELVKSGQFIVIERQKLDVVLEEQKLQGKSFMDQSTAVEAGKILGVNAIITGAVTQFGVKTEGTDVMGYKKKVQTAECVVDIRVVDAQTGRILYADSGKGVFKSEKTQFAGMGQRGGYNEVLGGEALRSAVSTFINNVISQINYLEWAGKIAKADGSLVYVNAGKQTGLKVGDLLTVLEKGEAIVDPDTGVILGEAPGGQKGLIEVVDFFGEDGGVCRVKQGSGFQVGDQVKLKK